MARSTQYFRNSIFTQRFSVVTSKTTFAFEEADVTLDGYRPHKSINAPIAV